MPRMNEFLEIYKPPHLEIGIASEHGLPMRI